MSSKIRWTGAVLGILGIATTLILHWMVFFWVPTERTMGIVQRIFYIHVPAAWVGFMAFGIVALCSAVYLWLGDERADMAALAAAGIRCHRGSGEDLYRWLLPWFNPCADCARGDVEQLRAAAPYPALTSVAHAMAAVA